MIVRALLAIALLGTLAHPAAAGRFDGPYEAFPVQAQFLAFGDLDGDGRDDLLTEDEVWLSRSTGGFVLSSAHSPASQPPVPAELDGDDRLDVVFVHPGHVGVAIRHGDGTGALGPELRLAGSGVASSPVSADLNHDGRPDVIAAAPDSVDVWYATGPRTYQRVSLLSGLRPVGVAVEDVNGDGRNDLVVGSRGSHPSTSYVSVHLGQPGGGLGPRNDYPATGGVIRVALAHLDQDSDLDLVVQGPNSHRVMLNDGAGAFAHSHYLGLGELATGDFDEDGARDLAVAPRYWGAWHVAVFTRGVAHATPLLPRDDYIVAAGDVNGDSHLDLALYGETLIVFLGNGDATFGGPGFAFTGLASYVDLAAFTDVDGDGRVDVASVDVNALQVSRNLGGLQFSAGTVFSAGQGSIRGLVALDVDGDSAPEIAIAVERECGYRCYRTGVFVAWNDGFGGYPRVDSIPHAFDVSRLIAGDVDRDGRVDLLGWVRDPVSRYYAVSTLRSRGDGTFEPPVRSVLTERGPLPGPGVLGDLDGNSIPDLATPEGYLPGLGASLFGGLQPWAPLGNSQQIELADLDGDGDLDVIEAGQGVHVRRALGAGVFTAPLAVAGATGAPIAVADVSGDGALDLASGSGRPGGAYIMPVTGLTTIHYGTGNGTFELIERVGGAHGPLTLVDADLDGWRDLLSRGTVLLNRGGPPVVSVDPGTTASAPAAPDLVLSVAPNPASTRADIAVRLSAPTPVRVSVLDLQGREVARLLDGPMDAGLHRVAWRAEALDSGVYFVRLWTPAATRSRRLVVIP